MTIPVLAMLLKALGHFLFHFCELVVGSVAVWMVVERLQGADRAICHDVSHLKGLAELRLRLLLLQGSNDGVRQPALSELFVLGELSKVDVVVVSAELRLHRVSLQRLLVLNEVIVLDVSPFFVDVSLVEVVFVQGNKWRFNFLFVELLPRKGAEPRMVLDLAGALARTEPVLGLALDHLHT